MLWAWICLQRETRLLWLVASDCKSLAKRCLLVLLVVGSCGVNQVEMLKSCLLEIR
uniref:Uncharacterized protein n=1 Tax=Rhizophora mucronata TaxID=61149 RepID=A0A2P2QR81_RHIMU